MQLLKLIFIFSIFIMLNACAISMAGKDEFIVLNKGPETPTENDLIISMSCPGKMYSMMASILVPLPPIIPIFWVNEEISGLFVTAPNIGNPELELISPSGERVQLVVTAINESQTHDDPSKKDYYFQLNKSCSMLDGHLISIRVGNKKASFYIRYTAGKVRFEWAYLSA